MTAGSGGTDEPAEAVFVESDTSGKSCSVIWVLQDK